MFPYVSKTKFCFFNLPFKKKHKNCATRICIIIINYRHERVRSKFSACVNQTFSQNIFNQVRHMGFLAQCSKVWKVFEIQSCSRSLSEALLHMAILSGDLHIEILTADLRRGNMQFRMCSPRKGINVTWFILRIQKPTTKSSPLTIISRLTGVRWVMISNIGLFGNYSQMSDPLFGTPYLEEENNCFSLHFWRSQNLERSHNL